MPITFSILGAALAAALYLLFTGSGPSSESLAGQAEKRAAAIEEIQALTFK